MEEEAPKRRGRPPKPDYPETITMTRPFGYIDDDGQGHMWQPGMVVESADEVKDIIDRGCKDWT